MLDLANSGDDTYGTKGNREGGTNSTGFIHEATGK